MEKRQTFVVDVSGAMTNGTVWVTSAGEVKKNFCQEDFEALNLLSRYIDVVFLVQDDSDESAVITCSKSIHNFPVIRCPRQDRLELLDQYLGLHNIIYMSDSFLDIPIFRKCFYSIAPANADKTLQYYAKYVASRNGGDKSVSEACFHIAEWLLGVSLEDMLDAANSNENSTQEKQI